MTSANLAEAQERIGSGAAFGRDRQRRLEAFHADYRRYVAALTSCSEALEDLTESFPALVFALATGYGTAGARDKTFALLLAGGTLKAAADTLGLPWWLRKLPAAAFRKPLGRLPDDAAFATQIANYAPTSGLQGALWLERVAYAAEAVDCEFALWIGRNFRGLTPTPGHESLAWLTAWAWHTQRTDTPGHRLLRKPWTTALGPKRALDEMGAWRQRVAMIGPLARGLDGLWLEAGTALGHEFVPLATIEDYIAEAAAMDNCLDQYSAHLEAGTRRIYSVRRNGRRIADLEVGPHPTETGMPQIVQLRGPRNRRADPSVWQATYAWLGSQPARSPSVEQLPRRRRQGLQAVRSFWAPHLTATAGTEHHHCFEEVLFGPGRMRARTPLSVALASLFESGEGEETGDRAA